MKTRRNLRIYSMIVLLTTLISCNVIAQENRTPSIVTNFDMNQPGTLKASSSGGGVVVKTHDKNEVEIQAFVRKNGRLLSPSDPTLDEVLEDFELDFSKNGSVITANINRKSRFNFWRNINAGISLTILVPREMSCNVSSSGGGVTVSGVDGTHNFTSSGGGVQLDNVSGTTKARSSGGGVKATNQNGDIQLSSSGGGVTVNEAYGNVNAHSSGGGVTLKNIHGDVEAGSSGGGVNITGEVGAVDARSSGGGVHVDISNLSKKLSLQSSGGGIDAIIQNGEDLGLDLDLSSSRVNIELHNFSGNSEKDRVKGTMNNGGIPVYMHASGGNVNVRFDN